MLKPRLITGQTGLPRQPESSNISISGATFRDCLEGPLYGGFHKWGIPKMDGLQGKVLLKWMIWRYPHFRKPPYRSNFHKFQLAQEINLAIKNQITSSPLLVVKSSISQRCLPALPSSLAWLRLLLPRLAQGVDLSQRKSAKHVRCHSLQARRRDTYQHS